MKSIKLHDLSFIGDLSSSKYHKPQNLTWYRGYKKLSDDSNTVFFTDMCLNLVEQYKEIDCFRIAWLIEPFATLQGTYRFIEQNYSKFDLVLSHHKNFIEKIPNGMWYSNGMCWIAKEDISIYNKSKMISAIVSDKNYTVGHKIRHKIVSEFKDSLDLYGKGYNPIDHKISALKDYRYSLAIENSFEDCYFTEKLLDCFLTGTIPIYMGHKSILNIFDKDGIFFCENEEDVRYAIEFINKYKNDMSYNSADKAISNNFEVAKQYIVAEDWIYNNILVSKKLV
jgi:hypothetical protein